MLRRTRRYPVPAILAALLGAISFAGSSGSVPLDVDAARHVMNGALIADMLRDGGWAHPFNYARDYYSRFPALSMPYHPPGYPAVEAIAFLLFGVHYEVARALIALCVAGSAFLLYLLILRCGQSSAVAFAATIAFFANRLTRGVSAEVMLEVPAILLLLGSMHMALTWLDRRQLDMRPAAAFAALAATAVWVKQHALFIVAIPITLLVLRGEFRRLWDRTVVVATLLVLAAIGGIIAISSLANVGNSSWVHIPLLQRIPHHAAYYATFLVHQTGWPLGVLLGAGAVLAIALRLRQQHARNWQDIFLAWFAAAFGLLLVIPPWDGRYLVYCLPALLVLGVGGIAAALPEKLRPIVLIPPAAILLAVYAANPAPALKGHTQAAAAVIRSGASRVLYCGPRNGAFTYAMRRAGNSTSPRLIRADKLSPSPFVTTEALGNFLYRYGIGAVAVESGMQGCDVPPSALSPAFSLLHTQALVDRRGDTTGTISVYRNSHLSLNPESSIPLRSELVKGGLTIPN